MHSLLLGLLFGQRRDGEQIADRGDALEHASLEQPVGEFDVELVLEREHQIHAGVRGHPGLVEVGVVGKRPEVDAQSGWGGTTLRLRSVMRPPFCCYSLRL